MLYYHVRPSLSSRWGAQACEVFANAERRYLLDREWAEALERVCSATVWTLTFSYVAYSLQGYLPTEQ